MLKKTLFFFVVLLSSAASAQTGSPVRLEYDLGVGALFTDLKRSSSDPDVDGTPAVAGVRFYGEARHNIGRRWDGAMQVTYAFYRRAKYPVGYDYGRLSWTNRDDGYYNSWAATLLADRNWRFEDGTSVFVGGGAGFVNRHHSRMGMLPRVPAWVVRAGGESDDGLRITLECRLDEGSYAWVGFSLGYAWGGPRVRGL